MHKLYIYKHAGIFKNTREVHREARGGNATEIVRAQTHDVSSLHYLWVRDCCECFVYKYTHALAAQ